MPPSTNTEKYVPALAYPALTRFYDLLVGLTTRERTFKNALIAQASIECSDEVLDIGCGTGTLAIGFKQQHPNTSITGIDGDPAILRIAQSKAEKACTRLKFDQGMSFDLPYRDNTFNTVISSLFFHHLSRKMKQQTAAEAYRVLKPGGTIHIADWGKPDNSIMSLLYYSIQMLDGFENTNDNRLGLLPETIHNAGFQNVGLRQTFNTLFGTMTLYSGEKPLYG